MKKIITVILLSLFFSSSVNAGWVKDFKKKSSNLIQKTRNTGRKISNSAKRSKRKVTRFVKRNKKSGRYFIERSKKFAKKSKKNFKKRYEQGKKGYIIIKKNYKRSFDKLRNPETQRKAKELFSNGMALRQEFLNAKRKGATIAIGAIAGFSVAGGMTLGEMVKSKLGNKFPGLRGTGLLNENTVVAVALGDKSFFLEEVDFIKGKDGRRVSVVGSIKENSPLNVDKTMKCLEVAGALEKLHNTDDVGGAFNGLVSAMDAAK